MSSKNRKGHLLLPSLSLPSNLHRDATSLDARKHPTTSSVVFLTLPLISAASANHLDSLFKLTLIFLFLPSRNASFVYSAAFTSPVLGLLDAQPGQKILDMGCGTGELTAQIQQAVGSEGEVWGVDSNADMVRLFIPARFKAIITSLPSFSSSTARQSLQDLLLSLQQPLPSRHPVPRPPNLGLARELLRLGLHLRHPSLVQERSRWSH